MKNDKGQIRAGWLILLALVAMLIAQQIFSLPGAMLLFLYELPALTSSVEIDILQAYDGHPWLYVLTQGGAVVGSIVVTYIFWRFVNKGSLRSLGFRWSFADFAYGLFLGAASITVIFLLLLATGNVSMVNSFSAPAFSAYTVAFLVMYILVGLSEEMFFRGYVMSTMLSRGNPKWAVYLVSAVVFSLAHGLNPNVSWLGLLNIVFVGVLFAYMFLETDNLWLPIGYHMTWNYFQGNVFGFAVSGTTPNGIYNVSIEGGNAWLTGGAFGLEGGLAATLLILIGFAATWVYGRKKRMSARPAARVESDL
ncbi:CPBP family intramembrane glutamic endopeptidase [Sporosarcina trichiuri]|uniref:CPBP family intramembrane glutamic endopeptidase n=1 Tax=Sporosarcina trichiuri TaxID=3056445 RepID=UPI0025B297AC|nr:type II CAAX endopeptidase family protein [Sporosarcina sp. 0.2-SM1T-5]WJY27290.1 type II CAAX endopeptidase family protein [Sporosarcina sp. 0.2-SM1T-5]